MSNSENLDLKDKRILYELDLNARQTFSRLAKKLHLSKQVILYRINRLEKIEFIKGYSAIIDTSRLGYITFRCYMKLRNMNAVKRDNFIQFLKSKKNIWAVVTLSGKFNVAIALGVNDIYQFYEYWEDILFHYSNNIEIYAISIYSPIFHYSRAYLIGEKDKSKIRILGGKQKIKIDEMDFKILHILSKNVRIPLVEIARILHFSPETIKYRIKNLEKNGVIQGYRAIIDVHKLGYHFFKANIKLASLEKLKEIYSFCHSHPNIYQIDKTIGEWMLEIEFHVKDIRDMFRILDKIEEKFPGSIESFEHFEVISEEKFTYMPEE